MLPAKPEPKPLNPELRGHHEEAKGESMVASTHGNCGVAVRSAESSVLGRNYRGEAAQGFLRSEPMSISVAAWAAT